MAAPKFPELEEAVLKEWDEKKIFEKTLEKTKNGEPFVFYEGPPTANGRPGIHHVLARAFKDLIPRFQTMRGRFVARKAGWDTHGLPVELEVEKRLGFKSKTDIEAYGIEKFNQECRKSVWTYLDEWQKMTRRMGYWLDMEHPYVTYHNDYVEKLWGVLAEVHKKGLLYEGHKIVPYCARCGTALSSHEVAQGYKEVKEPSVYVRFKLKGEDASILAWTTTPWTLPSNTALAVGPDITYVKAKLNGETLIVAKARLSVLGEGAEIISEMPGSELVGKSYEPLYDFIAHEKPAHLVKAAEFVTTTDGTGIVHIAPFGVDDMVLIKKYDLPVLMTVGLDGAFMPEVTPWAGKFVKTADPEIIKDLEARGKLLKTELYAHDYPFCWRCGTPLIYYPKNSWFIEVSKIREALIASNEKVNWVPAHIKEGRFGEWLKNINDWAISRERYWGTPLPLWKCGKGHLKVAGSLEEMDKAKPRENRFFVFRHGKAVSNENGLVSSWPEHTSDVHLTEAGRKKVRETAEELKKQGIDLIFSSDLVRTKETAEIIKEVTGVDIVFDERLRENDFGAFNGRTESEYKAQFASREERLTKKSEGGESYEDVRARVMNFLLETDRKYDGKKIVVVSHGDPVWFMMAGTQGIWGEDIWKLGDADYLHTGTSREIHVPNWPFDERGAVDVHRPFIDAVTLKCEDCGGEMSRVPEVMDVWFDSGAMPFAADVAYPADFISEAIDQTRGWFYTLLAVATLMGREAPYKNVICLGHLLDAKGIKMSKSKGNIVDPWKMFEKYGADAVRFHLYTVNQPGDAKRFDEKEVDGVVKKVFLITWNVLSYYKMFAGPDVSPAQAGAQNPKNVLDQWILSELNQLTKTVTEKLEAYDIITAGRAIADFVNDLSTWYVRRSRDRFKAADNKEAVATLGHALLTLAKLMAPFTPFVAEGLYKELGGELESVHLEDWPKAGNIDESLALKMKRVRAAASRGLEKRAAAAINVRQALATLTLKTDVVFEDWMKEIVAEEVNVKNVVTEKAEGLEAELDTALTPELKREGAARELTRNLNALRKEGGLTIHDKVVIHYETDSQFWKDVLREHAETIKSDARASGVHTWKVPEILKETEIEFDEEKMWIGIVKAELP